MNRIAKLERRRFLTIFWFLVGFLIYQGAAVVGAFSPSLSAHSPVNSPIITGVSLLGWAVWTYHLVRMLLLKREMSDRECRQMNDERVEKNRRQSFTVGFCAMMGATGTLLLIPATLTATTAAQMLILVGVVSSLGTFLYLESEGLSSIFGGPGEVAHE